MKAYRFRYNCVPYFVAVDIRKELKNDERKEEIYWLTDYRSGRAIKGFLKVILKCSLISRYQGLSPLVKYNGYIRLDRIWLFTNILYRFFELS
jgi:hypothetical protein